VGSRRARRRAAGAARGVTGRRLGLGAT
jgi:hypothetical protein